MPRVGRSHADVVSALTASIAVRRPSDCAGMALVVCYSHSAVASRGDWWSDLAWRQAKETCTVRGVECSRVIAQHCDAATPVAFYDTNRACLPPDICTRPNGVSAIDGQPAINAANLFGCALHAVLEPSQAFLNFKVAFHQGAENVRTQCAALGIQAILAKYYVIDIHFRSVQLSKQPRGETLIISRRRTRTCSFRFAAHRRCSPMPRAGLFSVMKSCLLMQPAGQTRASP